MDPSAAEQAREAGLRAKRSSTLDAAVRLGLVAFALVHLLIAWIAVQLALGSDTGSASGTGALHQLAQQPFGQVLLWVVGAGFLALVVWQAIEAAVGHTRYDGLERLGKRVASGFRIVFFGALGVLSWTTAAGAGSGSAASKETWTARLMSAPAGRWLVALVGAGIICYGIGLVTMAVRRSFTDRINRRGTSGGLGAATVLLGRAGYASKGVAAGLVGGLFAWAAWSYDAQKAGGLDAALHTVLNQPYGPVMLTVIGLGIGCFGLFCLVWARHPDE
ncbi:MAG: DUF1206 domain-containing protein [Nocardioidaceae bacterium]